MEENKQIIYLNKAGESWITDRFRHEWYEHNKNTTRYLKKIKYYLDHFTVDLE